MRINFRYLALASISIPLLPIMYYQGKRIRNSVPKLPEAKGSIGFCESKTPTQATLKLITLGESTIAGVGVETHKEGFTGTLAQELSYMLGKNISWKVYAHSGYTAKLVLERLIPKITEEHLDIIVIGLGANDAFGLNRPSTWNAHIHDIIKVLHQKYPNASIIFCHVPPIKEFSAFTPIIKFTIGNLVEILGEELQRVTSEYSYVYYFGEKIKLKNWIEKFNLKGNKQDFFSDGIHPSTLTYQIWAKDIAQKIKAYIPL